MGTHPIFESDFDCLTDFRMVKKGKKRQSKLAILEQDESKIEGPELKKQKSETESDESFVHIPSAKKIVEEMNQEESEDEELEDNVIDNDDIEFQGTNEPDIIEDIPIAKIPANPEEYPQAEEEVEEDRIDEDDDEEEDETAEGKEDDKKKKDEDKVEEMKDVRSTEDRTIFVKNLPLDATDEQIKILFSNAEEIRMLKKNNGASRGKAFIEMNSIENAEKASKFKNWTLDGRKLVVDLCGSKSATFEERTNMESTTLSVQGNTEFDEDDLRQTFEDAVAIRLPKNMENIAYVQFDSVEMAKKYKEMDLEINNVPINSKFVPDRISAERKRTKGTKWERKKAAKREAIIAEKKAQNKGDESNTTTTENHKERTDGGESRGRGGFRGRGGSRGRGDSRGRGRGDSRGRGGFRGRGDSRGGGFRGRGDSRGRGGFRGGRGDSRGGSRGRGDSRGRGRGGSDRGSGRGRGGSDRGSFRGRGGGGRGRGRGN